jgi:transcription elongation factor Elf1
MDSEPEATHQCEACGHEGHLVANDQATEASSPRKTLVCKVCGNEADLVFEEIEEP